MLLNKEPGLVVIKKINKTIEIKEKEHDEKRNEFLKLIQSSTKTEKGSVDE